jgi:hypothetical protein
VEKRRIKEKSGPVVANRTIKVINPDCIFATWKDWIEGENEALGLTALATFPATLQICVSL